MPVKSPFFERTAALCRSQFYKEWAGYHAVCSYDTHHDSEYVAFRHSAGLIDITPLFKYAVRGVDAGAFLSYIMARDISKLAVGRVYYCCWCTDDGKIIDDGTVMRRGDTEYFVTSADPSFSWFTRFAHRFQVSVEDVSEQIAALALQGPESRDILNKVCDLDLDDFRYFGVGECSFGSFRGFISRTGYTGDLGYEIWVENRYALQLWDAIYSVGQVHNVRPAGLDALDVTRLEAGLILKNVDYYNALHALIEDQMSSPYEVSLGWSVDLDREVFIGQKALQEEKKRGSTWCVRGIDADWDEIEHLYDRHGLPPQMGTSAWRESRPIYADPNKKEQVGYATSGTWSPILKKYIALATLKSSHGRMGIYVYLEYTVEHVRYVVRAKVGKTQFYNPTRKTA
jgi:aminomethyltransferase